MTTGATRLLYRGRCRRCVFIAEILRLAALGAISLEPLDRRAADQLAVRIGSRAKLLISDGTIIRTGPAAGAAFAVACLPRWAALAALTAALIFV